MCARRLRVVDDDGGQPELAAVHKGELEQSWPSLPATTRPKPPPPKLEPKNLVEEEPEEELVDEPVEEPEPLPFRPHLLVFYEVRRCLVVSSASLLLRSPSSDVIKCGNYSEPK